MTFFGKKYTYSDLDESIKKAAIALAKRGVQKGDRVAIMLPNCPQYPISFYGAPNVRSNDCSSESNVQSI